VPEFIAMPPRGHYLAQEVGRLAGVSGSKVGQWAHYGYIRASQSDAGEYPRVYSFQDVAEAIIVHELLDQKVPLKALRPVIQELRKRYGDWPLQHAKLETLTAPAISVASLLVRDGELRLELGARGWQLVEGATVNPAKVSIDLSRGGWAVRDREDIQHVEIDPDRLSGAPAVRGKRVPIAVVAELAGTIDGEEILRDDYDLKLEEIHDAQSWWELVAEYERPVAASG
jgi:uncharacterized protein (DUF433 family)/DNA-binding transcriptional MerR regulator